MRHIIDKLRARFISRKLMVWATATGALFAGALDSEAWLHISVVYLGGQSLIDAVAVWRARSGGSFAEGGDE